MGSPDGIDRGHARYAYGDIYARLECIERLNCALMFDLCLPYKEVVRLPDTPDRIISSVLACQQCYIWVHTSCVKGCGNVRHCVTTWPCVVSISYAACACNKVVVTTGL